MNSEPATDTILPTRQSLLSRLRDVRDQEGWREFFELYWRLIYNVARRAGLADAEAQDVVQNTFIYLSRKLPAFRYDPARGSFKSWLRVVTRSRIGAFRRSAAAGLSRRREAMVAEDGAEPHDVLDTIPDPGGDALDEIWQREWENNLVQSAMRRIRARVGARQLLIFRMAVLGEHSLTQVARKLQVSLPQVYLARHRVGRMFKAEVARVRQEMERGEVPG